MCSVTWSCLTLCIPIDCSSPGFSISVILQTRILERVASSYSRGSSWPRNQTHVFCISCIKNLAGRFFTTSITCCVVPSRSVMSDSLWPHGFQPGRLLCPWDSPGKNAGVGCHALLQGIFPTQGSNSGLPHCRQILYPLSHQGSPNYIKDHKLKRKG